MYSPHTRLTAISGLSCFWLLAVMALRLAAQPLNDREAVYQPIIERIQKASTSPSAIAEIARIAQQAESDHAATAPGGLAKVYQSAATIINNLSHKDRSAMFVYEQMVIGQRRFLSYLPLLDRLWMIGRSSLPLNTELHLISPKDSRPRVATELELLLRTWQELILAQEEVKDWKLLIVTASEPSPLAPDDFEGAGRRQAEYARNLAVAERANLGHSLQNEGGVLTNTVTKRIAREFSQSPHLLSQLQEIMDSYLPPSLSTNVMNKVFEAMTPEVAARTPRPVPGGKGERWLRSPAPSGPAPLPAIARPSARRATTGPATPATSPATAPDAPAATPAPFGTVTPEASSPAWFLWLALAVLGLGGAWFWHLRRTKKSS